MIPKQGKGLQVLQKKTISDQDLVPPVEVFKLKIKPEFTQKIVLISIFLQMMINKVILTSTGAEQSDDSSGKAHGSDIVDHGREAFEDIKAADDKDSQEQSIVVKDAEGGSFIFGNFVLFP